MNILYFMISDWNWIKQRPHFIAETLSNNYRIFVLYPHVWWDKKNMVNNDKPKNIVFLKLTILPKSKSISLVGFINQIINRVQVKYYIRKYAISVIYISHPRQILVIPRTKMIIVYDCMDNYIQLENNSNTAESIMLLERRVLERSNLTLVSSENLSTYLSMKYHYNNALLIRNAYNGECYNNDASVNINMLKIAYIGTVSEWFDWDLVEKSLKTFDNIEYYIFGPISGKVSIPKNNKIHIMGSIDHEKLFSEVTKIDVLIMPFIVNELIESVDPVKLYEYVGFGKIIISVFYKEIERFRNYVNFYNSQVEYEKFISDILNEKISSIDYSIRKAFLKDQTWNHRSMVIVNNLEQIIGGDKIE